MTSADRHLRLEALFVELMNVAEEDRANRLEEIGAEDQSLREELESLLAHCDRPRVDLDAPLFEIGPGEAGSEIQAGTVIAGRYTVERILGEGGMGVVWLAEQENPRRKVAIKLIRPGIASQELLRRFELEAAVLGRLNHPEIAQIYEAGMFDSGEGQWPFFAMEFVEGEPLSSGVRALDLNVRARIVLFAQVCDAVHHAHQKGVIHRDLKPANILVTKAGQPKVLDFGVARATDSDVQAATLQTGAGQIVGTLRYMSPEQIEGAAAELDTRSDVYALGVILYELLADRAPHELADHSIAQAARIITEEEPAPLDRAFRGDLNTIVLKALEKAPPRRYQSASDLAADLRRYLNAEPIVARPATTLYQLNRFARRNRGLVAGLVATILVLIIGALISLRFGVEATRARDEARWQAYIANIAAADAALRIRDIRTARVRLDAVDRELIDWEWRYLDAALDDSSATWPSGSSFRGVKFAPDGEQILTTSWDRVLHVWDVQTGEIERSFRSDRRPVGFDVAPDGTRVVTGYGKEIRIWDPISGHETVPDGAHESEVIATAFSHDGSLIASGAQDGVIRLWDGRTAKALGELRGHEMAVRDLAFVPGESRLVSASDDQTVRIWDIPGQSEVAALTGHGAKVHTVDVRPDGKQIASGGGDRTIRLWDAERGEPLAVLRGHDDSVTTIVFSPDGERLLSSAADRSTRIWDVGSASELAALRGHAAAVRFADWSPDGSWIITGESEPRSELRIWDAAIGDEIDVLREPLWYVSTIAFSPDGRRLASGAWRDVTGAIRFWDVETGLEFGALEDVGSPVYSVAWSPDGQILVAGLGDGSIRRFRAGSGAALEPFAESGAGDAVYGVAFDPSGVWLAAASGQRVTIRNAATGEVTSVLEGHTQNVRSVVFSPDGRQLVSLGVNREVRLWERATGNLIGEWTTAAGFRQTAFGAGGELLLAAPSTGVLVIDGASGAMVREMPIPGARVRAISMNPEGTRFACLGRETLLICDAATGQPLLNVPGHRSPGTAAAFSPSGDVLATCASDGTIRMWHTQSISVRLAARRARPSIAEGRASMIERLFAKHGDWESVVRALRDSGELSEREREVALQQVFQAATTHR